MFEARLRSCAGQVSAALSRVLDGFTQEPIGPAMRHACSGGKRLRAFLVMESARLHGIEDARSVWPAAAVEAIHAYSLVHDDLPCMDDDDLRRGQPTVHVKWDEATAVLAGDALQSLAFELLCHEEMAAPAEIRLRLIESLARAAGARGMVLGQAQDIAAESRSTPLDLEEISALQAAKTGALIGWAAEAGPIMAGRDPAPMRHYSAALGLAFQIADDLLDVEGDAAQAGKRLGKDAAAGKATFVSLFGVSGARARAEALVQQAEAALDMYGDEARALREAARFAISRTS